MKIKIKKSSRDEDPFSLPIVNGTPYLKVRMEVRELRKSPDGRKILAELKKGNLVKQDDLL